MSLKITIFLTIFLSVYLSLACLTQYVHNKIQQIPEFVDGLYACLSSSLIVTHSKNRTKTDTVQKSDTPLLLCLHAVLGGEGVC